MCMLSRQEVLKRTTFSNAQIYRVAGFPEGAALSDNRVAWYENEIDTFLLTRPRAIEDGLIYDPLVPPNAVRVLTEKQVLAYTTISRSNINRMIRAATFPAPIRLSVQKIGYLKHEVDHWLKNRPRASVAFVVQPSL